MGKYGKDMKRKKTVRDKRTDIVMVGVFCRPNILFQCHIFFEFSLYKLFFKGGRNLYHMISISKKHVNSS